MPSFRSRVLQALDIKKETVKLQVNETFPKVYKDSTDDNTTGTVETFTVTETSDPAGNDRALVDYAVSKELIGPTISHRKGIIGPNVGGTQPVYQTLDVLGFVVGDKPSDGGSHAMFDAAGEVTSQPYPYKNSYPHCIARSLDQTANGGYVPSEYTGFHYLNGIYDPESLHLQSLRKSAPPVIDNQTIAVGEGVTRSEFDEHAHKDWPDNIQDQLHKLNEDPYADSLFYHSMRLSFLLTGITIPSASEKASNHRGLVRMLILRPRFGKVNVRWTGDANTPVINMPYPPHWDTELFYSGKRTLAGRMENAIKSHKENDGQYNHEEMTHLTPTFGLSHRSSTSPDIDNLGNSIHYGHKIPSEATDGSDNTEDLRLDFNSYDMITAPVNREAYAVIADKTFTLDTMHHGVASHRLENVVIPFNKKVKFAGRETNSDGTLSDTTINEPLNLHSRPIIMFLSMDQKLSCQVTGYTAITET